MKQILKVNSISIVLFCFNLLCFAQTNNKEFFNACKYGDVNRIEEFINSGIDLNIQDINGNTPLMIASLFSRSDAIKLLVENNAGLNVINNDGQTALTLLRTSQYNSEHGTYLWQMYEYLQSHGAIEQDYVDFIARNLSGKHAIEQKKVLQIKQDYKTYIQNLKNYTTKKYHVYDRDGDDYIYNSEEHYYVARYDKTGNLVFFQDKGESQGEWEDNGNRGSWDTQYYFKDGHLFFCFSTSLNGYNSENQSQYRIYINNNKIVIVASKYYYIDYYSDFPEKMQNIGSLVNLIEEKDSYTTNQLLKSFNETYEKVKTKLK